MLRHRRLRDALVALAFREKAAKVFSDVHLHVEVRLTKDDAEDLAQGLLSSDAKARAKAETLLRGMRWSRAEIVALAYSSVRQAVEPHERKLAELERRRRRLFDDYQRLQALPRRRAVEDAEIVEPG